MNRLGEVSREQQSVGDVAEGEVENSRMSGSSSEGGWMLIFLVVEPRFLDVLQSVDVVC